MKKIFLILLCFLVQINLSCYYSKDFAGVYVANHPFGKDTLILYNNGMFKQCYKDTSKISYTNIGKWKFDIDEIEFDDFIWFLPGYGPKNKRKIFWMTKIHYTITGKMYLAIDNDLEYYYKKLN